MRINAGSGPVAVAGLATLAAMPKPLTRECARLSSPGIENDVVRVAADATSSRAMSSICAGTLMRSSAPEASIHTFTRSRRPAAGWYDQHE